MAGYTRQGTITNGQVSDASMWEDEYNALAQAFNNISGHKHDGSTAEGGLVSLISNEDGSTKAEVGEGVITITGDLVVTGQVTGIETLPDWIPQTVDGLADVIKDIDGTGSGIDADLLGGIDHTDYLLASDLLDGIKAVDGAGSGIDAELLAGYPYSHFLSAGNAGLTDASQLVRNDSAQDLTNNFTFAHATFTDLIDVHTGTLRIVDGALDIDNGSTLVCKSETLPEFRTGLTTAGKHVFLEDGSLVGHTGSYTPPGGSAIPVYSEIWYDSTNDSWNFTADDIHNATANADIRAANIYSNGAGVITTANMGSGNGFEADLLDGYHADDFLRTDNISDFFSLLGGEGSGVNADFIDGIDGVQIVRNDLAHQTIDGILNVTALEIEDGTHRITHNDGNGFFNIRVGNQYSVANERDEYTQGNTGAIHMKFDHELTTNPSLEIKIGGNPTGRGIGDEVEWSKVLKMTSTGDLTWDGKPIITEQDSRELITLMSPPFSSGSWLLLDEPWDSYEELVFVTTASTASASNNATTHVSFFTEIMSGSDTQTTSYYMDTGSGNIVFYLGNSNKRQIYFAGLGDDDNLKAIYGRYKK